MRAEEKLTKTKAAEMLGRSKRWLEMMEKKGEIYHDGKRGRERLYLKSELLALQYNTDQKNSKYTANPDYRPTYKITSRVKQ